MINNIIKYLYLTFIYLLHIQICIHHKFIMIIYNFPM